MNRENVILYLKNLNIIMQENRELLIDLDSVVGDGDLGLTMSDGFLAAYQSVQNSTEADIGKLLYYAGRAMATAVPSTMGTLMASGFMQAGKVLRDKQEFSFVDWLLFFNAFEQGVMMRGKAKLGEKTFLDGLHPAIVSLQSSLDQDMDIEVTAKNAMLASEQGYKNTSTMIAVHGRAATRGEESRKLQDPGAYVAKLMMEAFYNTIVGK